MRITPELSALWSALATGALLGHNLWLVASRRTVANEPLRLEINTSDLFPLSESAIAPERIADFTLWQAEGSACLTGFSVNGASLVAEVASAQAGTLLAALALHPRLITLAAEKFQPYLDEEAAHHVTAARATAGQANTPGREIYTKYAKALVGAGAQGDETYRRVIGQRLEIVPLLDPGLLRAGERLPVQVYFDGAPAANLRITSGSETVNGGAYAAHARTDAAGRAEIELVAPGRCFVRAHRMQAHNQPEVADWESCWASLSFRVGAEA